MQLWAIMLLAGACVSLVIWLIIRPAVKKRFKSSKDSALNAVWRLAWPWIEILKPICEPLMSWKKRLKLEHILLRAGFSEELTPGHVYAAQCLITVMAAVSFFIFTRTLHIWPEMANYGVMIFSVLISYLPRFWLNSCIKVRQHRISRDLPFLLDITTLCVEAGLNLQGALQQAAQRGPDGPLRNELNHVLADIRAGGSRIEAFHALVHRTGVSGLRSLVAALNQADALGMSLGSLLRAQAEQQRVERFQHAERLAMQAPIKMLFPLVICFFPCTFIVLAFPISQFLLEIIQ